MAEIEHFVPVCLKALYHSLHAAICCSEHAVTGESDGVMLPWRAHLTNYAVWLDVFSRTGNQVYRVDTWQCSITRTYGGDGL